MAPEADSSSNGIDQIVDQLDALTANCSTNQDATAADKQPENNPTTATQPEGEPVNGEEAPKKKKKKKRKPNKGKTLPTGFEDNFTEAPLTAEEFTQDQELYDPAKPVAERIEIAVQKYKNKRKFTILRHQLLEAYLHLGGINTGAKMFGGLDQKFINENEAEDIARFKATDYVPEKMRNIGTTRVEDLGDDYEEPEYTVDFEYIVRGFLTHRVPHVFALKGDKIDMAVQTIRNFLNYITYHNVCPEYAENLKQALETCDTLGKELPICSLLSDRFPGKFNKACSTLFGGYWSMLIPQTWSAANDADGTRKSEPGLSKEEALEIYNSSVPELSINNISDKIPKEIYKEYATLEVVSIWLPEFGSTQKLGKIHFQQWTPDDESSPMESKWGTPEGLTLYCEKTIAQYVYPKMHLSCAVHEMDNGLLYFDEISGVMCSKFLEIRDEKELEVDSDDFDFD